MGMDALTRSATLAIQEASLHVVVCSTHCFDETLINSLVKKNMNPIEKVERSMLLVASAVHGVKPANLVVPSQLERLKQFCPTLF